MQTIHRLNYLAGCLLLSLTLINCSTTNTKNKPDPAKQATAKSNVLVNLGMAYVERDQYQVAMDQFKKALEINPDSYDAHTAIANLYEKIDQPELADQHYKKAIELAPENPTTLNNYGKYLCNRGNYAEAEGYLLKAAKTPLYPRPWLPLTNAGQCMQRGKHFVKAEQHLRTALKKNPIYAPALAAMAQLSYQQNKFRSARAFLQRLEDLQQLTAEQLVLAVNIERALGDNNTAAKYAQQLHTLYPEFNPSGHSTLPAGQGGR